MRLIVLSGLMMLFAGCGGTAAPEKPSPDRQEKLSSEPPADADLPSVQDVIELTGPTNAAELDAKAGAELKEKSAEASAWLADPNHQVFNIPKSEAELLVNQFYNAGAPKVSFTGIEKAGEFEVSASLIVELPGPFATEVRADLFELDKRFYTARGEDGTRDVGQGYLWLLFE